VSLENDRKNIGECELAYSS